MNASPIVAFEVLSSFVLFHSFVNVNESSFYMQRQRDRRAKPVEHDREATGPEQVGRLESDQQRAQDTIGMIILRLISRCLKLSDFDVDIKRLCGLKLTLGK